MNSQIQTLASLAIVALALGWLVSRSVRKRSKPGCGGGCGCPSEELREKSVKELKRALAKADADIERGRTKTHDEVKRQLASWTSR